MAGFMYGKAKEKFLDPAAISLDDPTQKTTGTIIRWLADDIKVVLVDNGFYTPVQNTDEFLDDIVVGARIATSPNLAGKTITDGVANANDVTFTAVPGPTTVEFAVVYKDTGSAATSPLIALLDSADIAGLPLTPNGGDVTLAFDDGTGNFDGIFRFQG